MVPYPSSPSTLLPSIPPPLPQRYFGPFFTAIGYCGWTYMLNLLPYILVNRSAFIYHYMPALMYGER